MVTFPQRPVIEKEGLTEDAGSTKKAPKPRTQYGAEFGNWHLLRDDSKIPT